MQFYSIIKFKYCQVKSRVHLKISDQARQIQLNAYIHIGLLTGNTIAN